jgi:hypothetical protein
LRKGATTVSNATFRQLIDHKRPELGTFEQAYWYSTEFWKGPGSPVVVCSPSLLKARFLTVGCKVYECISLIFSPNYRSRHPANSTPAAPHHSGLATPLFPVLSPKRLAPQPSLSNTVTGAIVSLSPSSRQLTCNISLWRIAS